MNKEEIVINDLIYKDEFGNYIIENFEDLGMDYEFDRLNELTSKINMIGKLALSNQEQLDIANKKLDKIKELVNKYGYYTLSEIPELLSIIDGE